MNKILTFGIGFIVLMGMAQSSVAQTIQNIVPPSTDNADLYFVTTYDIGSFPHPEREQRIITEMPEELQGLEGLKTSHDDRGATQDPFLAFDLMVDSEVFVAWDDRCTEATWLTDLGWDNTGWLIHLPQDTDAPTRQVWRQVFDAGTVQLPPPDCGGRSNYFVLVNPLEEPAPLVWDFCDGLQGWFNANQSPVSWDGSRLVAHQAEEMPNVYDPHIAVGGLSHNLEAFPELAIKMTVANAPRAFNIGVFTFREGATHIRPLFSGIDNGEHTLRLNYLDEFPDEEAWTLTTLRLDIPENEPHADGGAWPDFQDMVVIIDWVALTDDPDFAPEPCPLLVSISGPGMVVQGEDVTLWADVSGNVGEVTYQWWKDGEALDGETENFLELLSVTMQDGGAYAVQVTDDNDTVTRSFTLVVVEALPASSPWALSLLGLFLLALGAVIVLRMRKQLADG